MIELNDLKVIDAGAKSMSDVSKNGLVSHFIYCGYHYSYEHESRTQFRRVLLTQMRSHGIKSAILTMLNMNRRKLITKEKVKNAYKGRWKDEKLWKDAEVSINDDLEQFFDELQNQKKTKPEDVRSFFTPKLTDEELKLVEERNKQHLGTYSKYYRGKNPDVTIKEMKRSDSKSKYVYGQCYRCTTPLKVNKNLKAVEKRLSDTKKKCIIL